MAQLLQPFNPTQFDPTQGDRPLPIGRHLFAAVSSAIKPTKGNDGGYLEYRVRVMEGEHAGAMGAIRFNLYNGSQQAVEIAHRQFSAFCHVCGVLGQVGDSGQLHEIPFYAQVEAQPGDEAKAKGYTQVTKFYDRNGNEPTGQPSQQQGTQQGAQQGGFGGGNNGQQQQPNNGQQGGNGQGFAIAGNGAGGFGNGQQGGAQGGQGFGGTWGNGAQGGQQGGTQWGQRNG